MNRQATAAQLVVPVSKQDHARGSRSAKVTLVEYGDFECPHCGEAHKILEELRSMAKFRFVFRHFPLTTMHPHAEQAAEAAEAAGAQGKFWDMHDLLFENQEALEADDLTRYAEQLDLDVETFLSEFARGTYTQRVRDDVLSGARSGVNGTPTFFINGFRHDGSYDLDSLLDAIEQAGAE